MASGGLEKALGGHVCEYLRRWNSLGTEMSAIAFGRQSQKHTISLKPPYIRLQVLGVHGVELLDASPLILPAFLVEHPLHQLLTLGSLSRLAILWFS